MTNPSCQDQSGPPLSQDLEMINGWLEERNIFLRNVATCQVTLPLYIAPYPCSYKQP